MRHRPHPSGVTLLELLVSLAVLSITAALAVPTFGQWIARNELATTSNRLLSTMMQARHHAIAQNVAVTLCAGNRALGCHRDWALREWLVFLDDDRDGRLDPGETVVMEDRAQSSSAIALSINGPFKRAIVFRPSGLARTVSGAFAAGRIRVCAAVDITPNATDLVLIGSGRAVTERHDFSGACPEP